jgi:hypothetical protein
MQLGLLIRDTSNVSRLSRGIVSETGSNIDRMREKVPHSFGLRRFGVKVID